MGVISYERGLPKLDDLPRDWVKVRARPMILIWFGSDLRGVLFDVTERTQCAYDETSLPSPTSRAESSSLYSECSQCKCLYEFYSPPPALLS